MQTTSALYNQIMTDINRRFEVKLVIDGVEYGTDAIFSAKTESRIFDNKPTIGGCYATTLDFSIISDGASIPRMASVIPYFRVVNDTQQSEWVQQGLFFIDQRKVTNNGDGLSVFTAECFDAMLKANAVYGTSILNWPATDTQVVAEIAAAIGVTVDPRTTAMLTKGFTIPAVPVEYTYRDILSFIGVVYAGNWIISDEGKLRLVPIGGNSDTLNIGKELMSMNVSPKRNGYTKVVITTSDGEAIESGSSDDMVMEAYCPYATQAIADDILTALSSYQYEPFDASGVWSDPAVEVGDKITAVEKTVVSYARTVNYGPGMVMNISAPDDGYIDHEYSYESPSERRYTRTIGDLKSEITLNKNKIALVVSETAGGLEINAASIVASINDSGSSVIISADKVDLEGYVTFSNLKTGGRNLLRGSQYMNGTASAGTGTWDASKFFKSGTGTITWNCPLSNSPVPDCDKGVLLTATSVGTDIGFGQAAYPSLQDGPFTLSFWVKGTAGDSVFGLEYYASSSDRGTISEFFEISQTNVWQRIVINFNNDHPNNIGGVYRIGYIYFQSNTVGNSAIICAPKLEYGNVATSWSPAPEDSPTFNDLATEGQTVIDGGNIKTNTITADKINLTDLFAQNITATNFNITGGSIRITTSREDDSVIELFSGQYSSLFEAGGFISINKDASDVVENILSISPTKAFGGDFASGVGFELDKSGLSFLSISGSYPSWSAISKSKYLADSIQFSATLNGGTYLPMTSGSSLDFVSFGNFGLAHFDIQFTDTTRLNTNVVIGIGTLPGGRYLLQSCNYFVVDTTGKCCAVLSYNKSSNQLFIKKYSGSDNWPNDSRIIGTFPVLIDATGT